ncbi:MAG: hypothetical protein GX613_05415 [Chloroflexi bacterium]|nr:hypothetical protein [Chloroflexota bacterium]
MTNLLDKLNVLIQSRVPRLRGSPGRQVPPALGRKADRELARLRARIEEALADDDRAQAEISALDRQIADWDAQADTALEAGQDAVARHAIRQMKLVEQRRTMAQAELDAHRRATADLIQQVNAFEATVAEARREISEAEAVGAEPSQNRADLRELTQRSPTATPAPVDDQAIEDDLARRRSRLSQ